MTKLASIGPGAIRRIGGIIDRTSPDSEPIFLVTGKDSFARCGAESALREALAARRVVRFNDFEANPRLADVEKGLAHFGRSSSNLILAVGGGSVLDMAKLIGILSKQEAAPADIVRGRSAILHPSPPVIAVPTTAGTGSEATHFAAVFLDHQKYSVAHESMLPVSVVIDPELTHSLSRHRTAVTGLDAFCQAVESMWSVNATESSQEHARQAIRLVLSHLPVAVHRPSPEARQGMCQAAHLAGAAINVSRTTAPHAISYTMTSRFGLPHGHAVALTLGPMLVYNSRVTDKDVTHPRGVNHVGRVIRELNRLLDCSHVIASHRRITEFIESLNLPSRLNAVGIRTPADRQLIADGVNPQRLANNPRALTRSALLEILEEIA